MNPSITTAEGYLELGLPQEAEDELENLEGEDRTSKEAWVLRCRIYQASEQWDAMRDVAKHLVSLVPQEVQYWLWAAMATRNAENLEAAEQVLRFALRYLPADAMIHYHLACYASQLGHLDEARNRLRVALDGRGDLKHVALQDPDLEPMWESVVVRKVHSWVSREADARIREPVHSVGHRVQERRPSGVGTEQDAGGMVHRKLADCSGRGVFTWPA